MAIVFQFSSVTQSCLTLCDPVDCSTPGIPDHHQLPEFTQTHAHWVHDAIQPSHPLSSPSPPTFNLSQHHGLFKLVSCLHHGAKVLEFYFQLSLSEDKSLIVQKHKSSLNKRTLAWQTVCFWEWRANSDYLFRFWSLVRVGLLVEGFS